MLKQLEALLFVCGKPIKYNKLSILLDCSVGEIKKAVTELQVEYAASKRGLRIIIAENDCQMVTAPEQAEIVTQLLETEVSGELTQPSLEALTVIAYRGPVTKHELEQIRGVNCSLILRNLLIRGLIEEQKHQILGLPVYTVTADFLSYLGLSRVQDLPRYEELSKHPDLEAFLSQADKN